MKKIKEGLFFITIIVLMGCSSSSNPNVSNQGQVADKIIEQTATQLRKEKELFQIGTTGRIRGQVIMLGIMFHYFQIIDLEAARSLIIYTSETFLKNINENQEIRPYLENDPFTAQNIYIEIWIRQPNGDSVPKKEINCISVSKGKVIYELGSPSELEPMIVFKEESYEEALQMVHSEQMPQRAAF